MKLLLAADIGNTNIVLGLYDSDVLKASARFSTREHLTSDEAGLLVDSFIERLGTKNISRSIIGSVVPHLTDPFRLAFEDRFDNSPVIVSSDIKLPITIEIDQPQQLGADRIANGAAGFVRFGGPVIIVDFGTATTLDIVNQQGAYIGGVIFPGPETSMIALARRGAKLHQVSFEKPPAVVGKSTETAMTSGMFYGTIGQIDFLIEKTLEETRFSNCTIIATGGLAPRVAPHSKFIKSTEPALTLEGLKLIAEMN